MDRSREGRALQFRGSLRNTLLWTFLATLLTPMPGSSQIRPIELEGIVVTGTPVPRTLGTEASHISVLDGEELRARGLTRVVDALAEVPGLAIVQNGSYGSVASLFLRGAEADHVKVLVDGIEVNQNGGSIDLSGLLLANVDRIEVARGPASALYGTDAMAGVINILTKRGTDSPQISFTAGAGSYGRREWSAGLTGGSEASSYALSVAGVESDGILELNNQFDATTVSGSFFAFPDPETRIGFMGRYGGRTYHFPTDNAGNVVDRNAFTYGNETSLGVEASRMLTDQFGFRGVVRLYSWDGGSDDKPDGPEDNIGYFGFTSLDSFTRTSLDLRGNVALPSDATFSAGVEIQAENRRSFSESLSEMGPSSGQSRDRRSNRAYYAHVVKEGVWWSGNAGVRAEDNEQYGTFVTYQVGASLALPGTGTRVRGAMGKGFKEPAFAETSSTGYTVGNPQLRPEQSRSWEIGLERPVTGIGAHFSLTWFDQTLQDLIQYTFLPPDPGGPNFFNVAKARSRGLEATARIPLGASLLSVGYSLLDTKVLNAGFDEGEGAVFVEGEALIRRPRHQVSLTGRGPIPRGHLFGSMRWVSERADRDFTGWPARSVELSPFLLLGVGGEVGLLEARGRWPAMDLQIRVENLLDESYQEVFGYPAPGRALLVGGSLRMGG